MTRSVGTRWSSRTRRRRVGYRIALVGALLNAWGSLAPSAVADPSVIEVPLPLLARGYPTAYPFQVTDRGFDDRQPRLSPDGRTIVFLSDRAGGTDVFTIDVAGGAPTPLTATPDVVEDTPVWSPEGTHVAFAAFTAARDWGLWRLPSAGGDAVVLLDAVGSDEVHPWYSADGSALYFSSNRSGNWDLYRAAPGDPVRFVTFSMRAAS